jgi:16S rRNA (uracil1498-N3)-methyltransferase
VAPGAGQAGTILLDGPEFHHCVGVARVRVGDVVKLLDGRGGTYEARMARIGEREAVLDVIAFSKAIEPPPVDIAIGIIKAPRFDLAVEKCTELGVRRFIPFRAERSVWRGAGDEGDIRVERIRRKIVASCKQSGRPYFPEIDGIESFESLVERTAAYAASFVADQDSASSAPEGAQEIDGPVLGIVGPEGGLSPAEMERLVARGAKPFSLGPFRLRSETAAICISYRLMNRRRESV